MSFVIAGMFAVGTLMLLPRAWNWAGMTDEEASEKIAAFLQQYDKHKGALVGFPQFLLMKKRAANQGVYSYPRLAFFLSFNVIIAAWALIEMSSLSEIIRLLVGTLIAEYLFLWYRMYCRRRFYQDNLETCQLCYSANCRLVGQLVDSSRGQTPTLHLNGWMPSLLHSNGRMLSLIMSVGGLSYHLDLWLPQPRYPLIAWSLKGDTSSFGLPVAVFLKRGDKTAPSGIHYTLCFVCHENLIPHTDMDLCLVSADLIPLYSSQGVDSQGTATFLATS